MPFAWQQSKHAWWALFLGVLLGSQPEFGCAAESQTHVGRDLPDYVTGDECLFCHRAKVGFGWLINAHQTTLLSRFAAPPPDTPVKTPSWEAFLEARPELAPFEKQIAFVLGGKQQLRFLRRSDAYGRLDLLTAKLHLQRPSDDDEHPQLNWDPKPPYHWDTTTFGQRCAGCHTTAVDSRTQAFSATSIDCYACHGDVDLNHTTDTSRVYLAKARKDPPEVIASTCGQCHIRTGQSRASKLPYANNFVVGDDLFADFEVDLSPEALAAAPPRERHILANIQASKAGNSDVTCLSCHNIHRSSGRKHRRVAESQYCQICHSGSDKKQLTYERSQKHHALCGY